MRFKTCLLCNTDLGSARDWARLDELGIGEEGESGRGWFGYWLPAAWLRDKIAPDICDLCWEAHRDHMRRRQWLNHRPPPFRQIYLWEWIARELERKLGSRVHRSKMELARKGRADLAHRWWYV